jgi:hypothetical protein
MARSKMEAQPSMVLIVLAFSNLSKGGYAFAAVGAGAHPPAIAG